VTQPRRPRVGIFLPQPWLRGGGEKHALSAAEALAEDYDVTVVCERPVDLEDIGRFHNLDLGGCSTLVLRRGRSLPLRAAYRLQVPAAYLERLQEWENHRELRRHGFDVFVNAAHGSTMRNPARWGVFLCFFPSRPVGLIHDRSERRQAVRADRIGRLLGGTSRPGMPDYQELIANSTFTAEWVQRWWRRTADAVCFPPCEDLADATVERRRVILNVGRFVAADSQAHHKRQDVLLDTFAGMTDLHEAGWSLHFVGPTSDAASRDFVATLRSRAVGLPVELHVAADHDELRTLANTAAIYWHATGYGTELDVDPERQEHFGMSTVEAMSAGAVPVMYAGAGARDTVDPGRTGLVWHTQAELARHTRSLVEDVARRARMSAAAQQAAAGFGRAAFAAQVRERVHLGLRASASLTGRPADRA